ncbi:MAG TPA: helicase-related protein [Candidatus Polarisedimenticolaceae bacterium]|nr:helicase-related protein [Candidatus Polarisedimenticolaceae bacterium]
MEMWKPGDRLSHRHNPDLGTGRVLSLEGRTLVVEFPAAGRTLRLAAGEPALVPVAFAPGASAMHEPTGRRVTVTEALPDGRYLLQHGEVVPVSELWPLAAEDSLVERLAGGDVDSVEDVAVRLDALHLAAEREGSGLGSFLGGRIRLFPHQLYAAERASMSDPVRWMLADEVGLGKTVEACLILNHLVRTGRAERLLVVAPATLVVQWLGELWRKYHQVFVLLDDKRLADVAKDFGPAFSPFDAHRRAVVALETLIARPDLVRQAETAGLDALVVDEAHHLKRSPGHPGEPAYRAVAPLARAARHVLLLTATPFEEDAHGFLRLVQLLRPDELPDDVSLEHRLTTGEPLPPCTSSTRRADIGGLPPRQAAPAELDDAVGWGAQQALIDAVGALPAADPVSRRKKAERLARALASGWALLPLLGKDDEADARIHRLAGIAADADPRVAWLCAKARAWKDAGDKTLVFVAQRETLEGLQTALSRRVQLRTGVFHEDMSPGQRDIEVAQFRLPSGPSLLLSTEAGGEGRNFEFCRRIVLFDLPWNPTVIEQRIGRLDRIGRKLPVEIVYFRAPGGLPAAIAGLYERLGLFREPMGGIERELGQVEDAIEEAALAADASAETLEAAVAAARDAHARVAAAADRALHREPFQPDMGPALLSRVPQDLDELTEDAVRPWCERLRLDVIEQRDPRVLGIEIGHRARVESLPGVPGGSRFVGTFERELAVEDESIDFFASGHPLVEGVLADLEDGPHGRTALLQLDAADEESGFGLVALYKDGPRFRARAVDLAGRERPEWAARVAARPLRTRRLSPDLLVREPGWPETVRRLAERLEALEPYASPVMVAAVVVG